MKNIKVILLVIVLRRKIPQRLNLIKRTLMADFNGRSRFKRPFPEYPEWKSCG